MQQHIKGGARSFILLHDGKAPADAMWTEAGEQAWRECPVPSCEFIARAIGSVHLIHFICILAAADRKVGHECIFFIVGKSLTNLLHTTLKGARKSRKLLKSLQ